LVRRLLAPFLGGGLLQTERKESEPEDPVVARLHATALVVRIRSTGTRKEKAVATHKAGKSQNLGAPRQPPGKILPGAETKALV
jgi:hypothetical protein